MGIRGSDRGGDQGGGSEVVIGVGIGERGCPSEETQMYIKSFPYFILSTGDHH